MEIDCGFFQVGFLSLNKIYYSESTFFEDVGVTSLIILGSPQPVISTIELPTVRNLLRNWFILINYAVFHIRASEEYLHLCSAPTSTQR
jgi:hypothetical protein